MRKISFNNKTAKEIISFFEIEYFRNKNTQIFLKNYKDKSPINELIELIFLYKAKMACTNEKSIL